MDGAGSGVTGTGGGDGPADWVPALLERYRRVVASQEATARSAASSTGGSTARAASEATPTVAAFNTLRLADALLDKRALSARHPDHPVQLSLLGPTQSGKSTLANLTLDADVAGVSALAGHTVHATGFAAGCGEDELAPLAAVMAPLERVPRAALSREALDAFALDAVAAGPDALLGHGVVWDTPDFDSIEAGGYRGAVLQGAAVADVLLLVASKDKYGDRSVWDMLGVLRELGRPLVIVLNKLDAEDEPVVVRAFTERFAERFGEAPPALVTLPFVRARTAPGAASRTTSGAVPAATPAPDEAAPAFPDAARARLGEALGAAVADVDRARQATAVDAFVAARRDAWLAPLGHELAAAATWRAAVAAALDEAEQDYVRRYLDDPRKYDTFNRALAELLTLLELPGIAHTLARTRELVTWPARTLLGIGRRRLGVERAAAPDQEAEALALVLERTLARLRDELIERRESEPEQAAWWRAAQAAFRARREGLEARFEARGDALRAAFEPRIEEAANRLYERLREQPRLLATLRAARVTTDAAGVALAVKSGGLAPADLVLAPAMLSVTTLLTEGALGRYLDAVRRELQAEQRAQVRRELLDGVLGESLHALAAELDDPTLLGGGLDPVLARAAGLRTAAPRTAAPP